MPTQTSSADQRVKTTTSEVLRLEGLRKNYGEATAIEDIDLSVHDGEFVTMLGPSGSGKTTTLLAVAGFVMPDDGVIRLAGADVSQLPAHKRNIGMVFQSYALFPHLTVAKNVAFPLTLRGIRGKEADRIARQMLETVHLGAFGDRYPRQLSGGQQQRVALARAMVFKPRLLLMDEPLGALDKRLRATLQFEIKRISTELGATVLYVTHDQEEAMAMSDRIAVYRDGRIEQVGTPASLYEKPDSAFVAEFLGESNILRGRVSARGDVPRLQVDDTFLPVAANEHARSEIPLNGEAALVVRPERIVLSPLKVSGGSPSTDDVVRLTGTVGDVVYLGPMNRITVTTSVGVLLVQALAQHPGAQVAPGDQVEASWACAAGVLVRK